MLEEQKYDDICNLMTNFFIEISKTRTIIIALDKLINDDEYSKKDIANMFDILKENYDKIEDKFKEFENTLLK